MNPKSTFCVAGIAAALAAAPLAVAYAQVRTGTFQVTPYAAFLSPDNSSAIRDAGMVGIEAAYYFAPSFAVGVTGNFGRSKSDGTYFGAARFPLGDSLVTLHIDQKLSIATYGAIAKVGLSVGRLSPFVAGGVGGYFLFLDPQSNDKPVTVSDLGFEVGGGFHLALTERAGIRADLRDLVFTGYDRDALNLVNPRFRTDTFLEGAPPPEKATIHNVRVSFGFSYLSGR
ncbi:MAG: outer membrane beta-barrel protein [Gemmatimonadetes bacterium]|nr:outer membrane beta-barrel protein [Gemmatimonadota bacterium]